MKVFIVTIVLYMMVFTIDAQTTITIDQETMEGQQASTGWIFANEADTILAFKKEDYRQVMEKYAELQEQVRHLKEVLQTREDMFEAYETYESAADKHIAVQRQMLGKADSLYSGYRNLYNDLKSLYGMRVISVYAGSKIYRYGSESWKPLLNIGVEYQRFQGSYLFGKNFNGIGLQYRIVSF